MSVIDRIKAQAKTQVKHIVLAEGSEPRTVQAAAKIVAEGLAKITLIGKEDEIQKVAAETGTDRANLGTFSPYEERMDYSKDLLIRSTLTKHPVRISTIILYSFINLLS